MKTELLFLVIGLMAASIAWYKVTDDHDDFVLNCRRDLVCRNKEADPTPIGNYCVCIENALSRNALEFNEAQDAQR